MVQGNRAVETIDGDQALIEPAFGYGDSGPALAFQSKRVDILAGDAFHRGDGVGADALVALGMDGAQVQIALVHARRADLGQLRRIAHHLAAARDDHILLAGHDGGRRQIDRGDAGAAEAVERHAAGLDVIAGVQSRHAAHIRALHADLGRGAPDHIIHLGGVDAVALGQSLQHGGGQMLRVQVRQRALADLANAPGRADGVDDPSFSHGFWSSQGI